MEGLENLVTISVGIYFFYSLFIKQFMLFIRKLIFLHRKCVLIESMEKWIRITCKSTTQRTWLLTFGEYPLHLINISLYVYVFEKARITLYRSYCSWFFNNISWSFSHVLSHSLWMWCLMVAKQSVVWIYHNSLKPVFYYWTLR